MKSNPCGSCRNHSVACYWPCRPFCCYNPPPPPCPPCPPVESYRVVYDPNGGSGGTVDSGLAAGSSYTVKDQVAANVVRPGYLFVAWNSQADGSGTPYAPGQVLTLTANITLYAQWAEIPQETFTVIYDPNGGSGGLIDPDWPAGTIYTIKTQAQANVTGTLIFIGWNTQADGSGSIYTPAATLFLDADLTLYAQWFSRPN